MTKRSFNLRFVFIIILIFVSSSNLFAVEKSKIGFGNNHFVGGRFGAWTMTTDASVLDSLTDFSNGALFAEFFYAHRIAPFISGEFTFGIFSQGDLEYNTATEISTGATKLYPVFISAKLYPLSKYENISLWPYVRIGGGLVYGTRDFTSNYIGDPINYSVEESEAKITYTWGFGIDWPIADQIGLNIDFKTTPVKFKDDSLAGLNDYSGWSLTVGVGYILKSK